MGKLFKRGRIWFARVPQRGGGTKRVSTYCTDKRAAEAALPQLEREAVDPAFAAANRTTTQEILADYYLSRERAGRAKDSKKFVWQKSRHLVRLLPEFARNITHAAMGEYVDARLKEWAVRPVVDESGHLLKAGRPVKRTTVRKELSVAKAALYLARRNGKWLGEPEDVIPEVDDDHEDGKRFLTHAEMIGLASVLPPRRMAVVAFAVATGCEAQALWRASAADVAADKTTVQIHGRKRKSRDRPAHLALPEQRVLVDYALRNADHLATGLLFAPWANMRRDLTEACKKIGAPPCNANDLRRTYGSWLRQAGVAPQLIGASMGHADSRMVERVYGKLPPEDVARLLGERVAARDAERALVRVGQTMSSAGPLVGHRGDVSAQLEASGAEPSPSPTPHFSAGKPGISRVRRDRIELSTRGFSVRPTIATKASETIGGIADDVGDGGPLVGHRPAPWVLEAVGHLACLLARVAP